MDDYLQYALASTMTTLEKCWKPTLSIVVAGGR